jgi:3-oxoacyl-[acyl-carrier-protein] synthase II
MIPQMISNMAAGLVAIEFNLRGPNTCVVTACASAAHSIGDALRVIQRGDADIMLGGGAEASVCTLGVAGFCALKALCANRNEEPEKASRPFDLNRSGFVIADGSAILILEEYEHAKKRNARIYCELSGFGMSCDAFHITAPMDDGSGAARAMTAALRDAKMDPSRISYVNAHGTSTNLNDKIETKALKLALGEANARKAVVNSTKSMTGHTLGAAAAIESAALVLSIYKGVVHPTINQETPDPECDLDYVPNTAREVKIDAVLKNSLGFGGHNACLVYNKI